MNSVNPSIFSENSDKIQKNNFTLCNNHTIDKSDPDSNTHKFLLNTIKSNKISNGPVCKKIILHFLHFSILLIYFNYSHFAFNKT